MDQEAMNQAMKREERVEQEVEKTLQQFDRAERIRPDPFFYTRVQARLKDSNRARGRILVFGVLKPALLVLLVACNVATAAVLLKSGGADAIDRSAVVSAVGEELGLDTYVVDPFLNE